jgi:hypothetical protein
MISDAEGSVPLPICVEGLKELTLLETELMARGAQLLNFTPLRDRLVASGQDANAAYRKIQSRRDDLAAQVAKLTPAPAPLPATVIRPLRPGASLLSLPIAPARIIIGGGPWFGSSGSVQIGRAQEGVNVIPHGKIATSGAISTLGRFPNGVITFGGFLDVSFEAAADTFDPSDMYVWLQNWNYLFFFPPPAQLSTLTYSFEVHAFAFPFLRAASVTLMSFASIGETANFVGVDVPVTTSVGFPLNVDLTQPYNQDGSVWNGQFGWVQGKSIVQRSFDVGAGHTPAVALVVGVATVQSEFSAADLSFPSSSFVSHISPASSRNQAPGVVDFHYQPIFENAP